MKVEQIMTSNPVFLKETDFMTHARQVMRDQNKRTVPVVDNKNRVVGVLNEKEILNIFSTKSNVTVEGYSTEFPEIYPDMDMIQAAKLMIEAGLGRVPILKSSHERTLLGILSIVDIFRNLKLDKIPLKKVSEIMTTNVLTCSPKDNIAKVWLNMKESGLSGYPVIKDGQLIGMVTRRNIIKAGYARIEREDENGTKSTMSPPVEKIMSIPAYTLPMDANLKEAIQAFMKLDVGRLSVVNNGKLVGIIDRSDILKSFI
ncbi:MAG: CBS domain-containing protein [Candidatus Methanoperedens sp.]|nr:CBS domain-containing protein [Candidatus Methanoperedens sp.]MCE8424363.1 CBS domain-containing protein [Candidatus Methanoperedens sp.]MCE8428128.1 CBS domain-containing protein [Candidatus Methanoperedens sp.]